MRRASCLIAIVSLLPLLATSCILRGPEDIRRELSHDADVELDRAFGIRLGRCGVALARWGLKKGGESDIPLKGVKKVEVGVYEVVDGATPRLAPPNLPGWHTLVRMHEDGDNVFVMTRERDGQLRKLLVVVAEDDEWVLVRISGKLDRLVEDAMHYAMKEAGREDLYDDALEAYRDSGELVCRSRRRRRRRSGRRT
jgi:hypothetical protein